jgi:hypothetical protein
MIADGSSEAQEEKERETCSQSTLVGLVPLIRPLKDLLAAVGRVQTTMVSGSPR